MPIRIPPDDPRRSDPCVLAAQDQLRRAADVIASPDFQRRVAEWNAAWEAETGEPRPADSETWTKLLAEVATHHQSKELLDKAVSGKWKLKKLEAVIAGYLRDKKQRMSEAAAAT